MSALCSNRRRGKNTPLFVIEPLKFIFRFSPSLSLLSGELKARAAPPSCSFSLGQFDGIAYPERAPAGTRRALRRADGRFVSGHQ